MTACLIDSHAVILVLFRTRSWRGYTVRGVNDARRSPRLARAKHPASGIERARSYIYYSYTLYYTYTYESSWYKKSVLEIQLPDCIRV